jgi:RNA polymerase sigma-70 factor (ECF subfamily)
LEVHAAIEQLFRKAHGQLVARLTHTYGIANLEKVEDAVQEALLKAMQVWGYTKMPDNPVAWLYIVARNKLIDQLRKDRKKIPDSDPGIRLPSSDPAIDEAFVPDHVIADSQLKMIFACCHPALSTQYQLILSLKLIGGFSNRELADALLKKEETVAKAFTRAKKQLKERVKNLESPMGIGLRSRLFVVLRVIYLLFNEGYAANAGTQVVKRDICYEAIRLALLLRDNPYCRHPELEALIALMCFHASRFDARIDTHGKLMDLEHQNRRLYNKDLIRIGCHHFRLAAMPPGENSRYYLEAAVSYEHCRAVAFKETRWGKILELYDRQLEYYDSPVVALNRLVPYYFVHGYKKGRVALAAYQARDDYRASALYYAISAEIFKGLGQYPEALKALQSAIKLSKNGAESAHFRKKAEALQQRSM